jgi:uncharacterized membrane protein YphA (DoxX/SURF4 family)
MSIAINSTSAQSNKPLSSESRSGGTRLAWQIGIWSAQILQFLAFGPFGLMKTFLSPEALVGMGLSFARDVPYWLLRFIGISELAGSLGIVLPALTRVMPFLTPLAALGFVTIQVLAIGFHIMRGEFAMMVPLNFALLGLSLFVLWGRTRKLPISPRY